MRLYNNYLDLPPTLFGHWLKRRRALAELKMVHQYVHSIHRVVEVGPGHGAFAELINEEKSNYVAFELNQRIAHRIGQSGFSVCRASIPPFPLETESVDLVYASHVIEHLRGPQAALAFVQDARRILRLNGLLVVSAPDILAFGRYFWDVDYTHTFPVSETRLRQLLADGNMDIMEVRYFFGPISGLLGYPLNVLARSIPLEDRLIPQHIRTRLRRFKFTFLRNICIVARKVE